MNQLTQTVLASAANGWAGNCWQTCVAIVLGVDPDLLPPQAECDLYTTNADGSRGDRVKGTPYYQMHLRAYLRKHHGLAYVELHEVAEVFEALAVVDDRLHMLTGPTVRSASLGGLHHVVVARRGKMVWDPHPSRAGLLAEDNHWAFLVSFPKYWTECEKRNGTTPEPCVCPACVER